MDTDTLVTIGAAVLGGGGISAIVTAWAARRKATAESGRIEIGGHIEITDKTLTMLHAELERINQRSKELEDRVAALEAERLTLAEENTKLQLRVAHLEQEIDMRDTRIAHLESALNRQSD